MPHSHLDAQGGPAKGAASSANNGKTAKLEDNETRAKSLSDQELAYLVMFAEVKYQGFPEFNLFLASLLNWLHAATRLPSARTTDGEVAQSSRSDGMHT